MKDAECVAFLQWALPRLGMRWPGYRKVRSQVCKRVIRRCRELGVSDVTAYRDYLAHHPDEWQTLDTFCAITISRFWRDAAVFDRLCDSVLPALAQDARRHGEHELHAWSIGCASGEEPYSVALAWHFGAHARDVTLHILGTDIEPAVLVRAHAACYGANSIKSLPAAWRAQAFEARGRQFCLRVRFRENIVFRCEDVRKQVPEQRFRLILCRNLAFTYFDDTAQRAALDGFGRQLKPGGALVIGTHERLPANNDFETWPGVAPIGIYRYLPTRANA